MCAHSVVYMCLPSFTFHHKYYNHSFNHPFEHFPLSHTHHSHMLQKSWTYTLFICHLGLIKWICCTHTRSSRTHTHAHTQTCVCVYVFELINRSIFVLFGYFLFLFLFGNWHFWSMFCLHIMLLETTIQFLFSKKQKIQQNDAFLSFSFWNFWIDLYVCICLIELACRLFERLFVFQNLFNKQNGKISLYFCVYVFFIQMHILLHQMSSPSEYSFILFSFFGLCFVCQTNVFHHFWNFFLSFSLHHCYWNCCRLCAHSFEFFSALNSNKYLVLSTLSHLD